MSRGRLISFEGLDGAGKTTQIQFLEQWLIGRQVNYLRTREPGGTSLGVEIRRLLFHQPELVITPLAEALLFQADRAQHFSTLVLPALEKGVHVITDRCFDSSVAYQGVARGVGVEVVRYLSMLATQGHVPDLTIFLDLDPTIVHERTGGRGEHSRFDRENEQFHAVLREAFLTQARTDPERIKIVNAAQTPGRIHREIVALVSAVLSKEN